jgi:hypothetical protein
VTADVLAERTVEQVGDESDLGRALGDYCDARQEGLGIALLLRRDRCRKLADLAACIDIPERRRSGGVDGWRAVRRYENLRGVREQLLHQNALAI